MKHKSFFGKRRLLTDSNPFFRSMWKWTKDSAHYVNDSWSYIFFAILVFVAAGFVGFFYAENFRFLDELLRAILNQTEGLSGIELTIFIFNNNVWASLFGILFGIFLGLFPLLNALTNGVLLGYVLEGAWQVSGIKDFWRILPHGIFELPAVFISLGMGMKLGTFIFEEKKMEALSFRLRSSMKTFLCIVVPLLVIAAIIEGMLIALFR